MKTYKTIDGATKAVGAAKLTDYIVLTTSTAKCRRDGVVLHWDSFSYMVSCSRGQLLITRKCPAAREKAIELFLSECKKYLESK